MHGFGCMILAAPAWAQTPNLGGEWEAPFTVGTDTQMHVLQVEDVRIQQSANTIEATKITGDQYVPAGTVDLKGTITSGPFADLAGVVMTPGDQDAFLG